MLGMAGSAIEIGIGVYLFATISAANVMNNVFIGGGFLIAGATTALVARARFR